MDVHGGRAGVIAVLACWASAIILGKVMVLGEASKPGAARVSVCALPEPERGRFLGRRSLFVFAHPMCPCTPATLARVRELLAAAPGSVEATVYFDRPANVASDWESGESWRIARSIPGLTAVVDFEGAAARRFRATTSGDVLIFDARGRRVFQGGVTARRGDPSENAACQAALDVLAGKPVARNDWPVFGCPLFRPTRTVAAGAVLTSTSTTRDVPR